MKLILAVSYKSLNHEPYKTAVFTFILKMTDDAHYLSGIGKLLVSGIISLSLFTNFTVLLFCLFSVQYLQLKTELGNT